VQQKRKKGKANKFVPGRRGMGRGKFGNVLEGRGETRHGVADRGEKGLAGNQEKGGGK